MNDPLDQDDNPAALPGDPPPPVVERRNRLRLSLVWLVPLLAVAVGLGLAIRERLRTGPVVTLEFLTAEGLQAGRTEVRYKEVVVGQVIGVGLTKNRQRVEVTVQLDKRAENMAVEDSRFWVVRPRIGGGAVSGLGTLLSGAYIGVDAGESDTSRKRFTGLEVPPLVLRNEPGRRFVLTAPTLGSLDIGSPVYYRRTRVGRVVGYELDASMDFVSVQVFVESPHEKLVTDQSRFWNASGVDVTLNASGLQMDTQSLASVIAGGVSFANAGAGQPAAEGTRFRLSRDRATALQPLDGPPQRVRMVFEAGTRGLAVGAPVEVLGVEIGRVTQLQLNHNPQRQRFSVTAEAELFPLRLNVMRAVGSDDRQVLKQLVDAGMRAELRTGSLLTGQMYVALDFPAKAAPARFDAAAEVPLLPTVPGALSELQPQVMAIVRRLGEVRFDAIGNSLQQTLDTATSTLRQLTPEAQQALAGVRQTLERAQKTLAAAEGTLAGIDRNVTADDAPLQRNAQQTLQELQRTARALRTLADYLQRHPESLLRGKPADAPLAAPANEAPR